MGKGKRENLRAANELTEEELRRMASNGGKKSVEVRRRKKTMREALEMLLYKTELPEQMKERLRQEGIIADDDMNHQMMITRSLIAKAEAGDVQAYNAICGMIGEKPAEKVEMSGGQQMDLKVTYVTTSPEDPGPRIIDSYGGVSLHKQSHGESFMALVANRFGGNGLYILDEPEAALSPSRILELMCHIHELEKKNSQFIISTHSPILMAYPGAEILYLTQDGIRSVSYKETEHYLVTKQFLNNPGQMCKYLFADD